MKDVTTPIGGFDNSSKAWLQIVNKFIKLRKLLKFFTLVLVWFGALVLVLYVITFNEVLEPIEREWCDEFRPKLTYKACSKEFSR